MPTKSASSIYQMKIMLRDPHPPIWQRVLVPGGFSLYKLYQVIQLAMGFMESHLHQFIIDSEYYSIPGVVLGIRVKIGHSVISFMPRESKCRC